MDGKERKRNRITSALKQLLHPGSPPPTLRAMPAVGHGLNSSASGSSRHESSAAPEEPAVDSTPATAAPSATPSTHSATTAANAGSPADPGSTTALIDPARQLSAFSNLSVAAPSSRAASQASANTASSMGSNNPLQSPHSATSRSQSYNRPGPDDMLSPPGYSQSGQPQPTAYGPSPGERSRGVSQSSGLPGALQAGRPHPASPSGPNPSTVPILPPISTQNTPGFGGPSRPGPPSHAHSYSRSSPAAGNFPDASTTPTHKYASQTPQMFSPLGLADIRPLGEIGPESFAGGADPYVDENFEPENCQYIAPWPVYTFDWCKWPVPAHQSNPAGRIAIGSYLEDGHNYLQVIDTEITPNPDPDPEPEAPRKTIDYHKLAEATVSYPVTRILWEPESKQKTSCDLLATSGDHLRLWSIPESKGRGSATPGSSIHKTTSSSSGDTPASRMTPLALLSNSKSPEHTAPLTSLDWNTISPSLIITSSIDTTCTIWDIPSLTAKTQLIAHDKEVFDVRFCANSVDVFVSCGADGSVRMFDLRSLEHSTIIYEPSDKNDKSQSPGDMSPTKAHQALTNAPALLRLATSPHDQHLLATFAQDSSLIRILDVRQPGQALLELSGHRAAVNCMEWCPARRGMLTSGGDDSLVLVWDLINQGNAIPVGLSASTGSGVGVNGSGGPVGGEGSGGSGSNTTSRGPFSSWTCDYEVNNLSWAPPSRLTQQSGDWLGVVGGRSIWALSF